MEYVSKYGQNLNQVFTLCIVPLCIFEKVLFNVRLV